MDFSPIFKYDSFLLEADDDNATGGDTGGNQEAPADQNNTQQNADNGNVSDADLDINLDDNTGEGGGGELDAGTGDTTGGGDQQGDPNAAVDTEAKKKDRELFDTLTPQEQKLKT